MGNSLKALLLIFSLTLVRVQTDRITDVRDGEQYSLIQFGDQTWIRENIRFRPEDPEGIVQRVEGEWKTFGAYYSWDEAQKACPEGFHLPSLQEWASRYETYAGSENPRKGRFVHQSQKDSSLLFGGMVNNNQLRAQGRMGLFWTATDSTSTFGVEGGELKPAYLAIHVYGDYVVTDSVNIEPTWSNSAERLFNCKCIKD